jgi:hypothetical protein
MAGTRSRSQPENRSFSFQIVGYDHTKREYILKNEITGETKTIPRESVLELLEKQNREYAETMREMLKKACKV